MLLGEAIARNVELRGELLSEGRLEKAAGVQLGIEALKREVEWRKLQSFMPVHLLPGETK